MIDQRWCSVFLLGGVLFVQGCTVKAVGDPNRPITINAHITLDIKGLEKRSIRKKKNVLSDKIQFNKISRTTTKVQLRGDTHLGFRKENIGI